jgi:hypothetical protein
VLITQRRITQQPITHHPNLAALLLPFSAFSPR